MTDDDAQDGGPLIGGDPAARLLTLLDRIQRVNGQRTLRQGWAEVLAVGEDDLPTLLSRVGDVLRLPGEVRGAIEGVAADAAELTSELPDIERLLVRHVNLTTNNPKWEKFKGGIPSSALVELRWVSRELKGANPWPTARQGEVNRALALARELVDEVVATDLDPESRHILLSLAQDLRESLERFQVSGAEGITRAVERTVGGGRLRRRVFDRLPDGLRRKFAATTIAALQLVQTGAAVAQLNAGSEQEPTIQVIRVELGVPDDDPLPLEPGPGDDQDPGQETATSSEARPRE